MRPRHGRIDRILQPHPDSHCFQGTLLELQTSVEILDSAVVVTGTCQTEFLAAMSELLKSYERVGIIRRHCLLLRPTMPIKHSPSLVIHSAPWAQNPKLG